MRKDPKRRGKTRKRFEKMQKDMKRREKTRKFYITNIFGKTKKS